MEKSLTILLAGTHNAAESDLRSIEQNETRFSINTPEMCFKIVAIQLYAWVRVGLYTCSVYRVV